MLHALPQSIHQGHLEEAINSLFKARILSSTGSLLELDVWIPNLKLCFEFQDPYHYSTSWDSHIPLALVKEKDSLKREEMQKRGETLVVVPFWWDGSVNSLAHTISFMRPDLLMSCSPSASVIPLTPKEVWYQDGIPEVGELMLASFPSVQFPSSLSPSNAWWMGEKYDGLRICWNPLRNKIQAYEIIFPYCHHLPSSVFLDGEIWFGRGFFVEVQKLLNTNDPDWSFLRMVSFDNASPIARDLPFEDRYTQVLDSIEYRHPFVVVATRVKCEAEKEMKKFTQHVINEHGEGVILRQPASLYFSGRSPYLFKLKATRGDAEGLVMEVGNDNWLELQLPSGAILKMQHKIGELEDNNNIQPKRGDIVSFSYDNFSQRSLPVNPKILRIRQDVTWENIVKDFLIQEKATSENSSLSLNEHSSKVFGVLKNPMGYWREDKGKNMKAFFENFAKKNNFDPLVPENWYSANRKDMKKEKGSNSILSAFKGSFSEALVTLFPTVEFEKTKFSKIPHANNRRNYLLSYAKTKNFDPLVAKNWYRASRVAIVNTKGLASVVWYYQGNFTKALLHLFPEIGLDPTKFAFPRTSKHGKLNFTTNEARKKFFINYANKMGFDPQDPSNWYKISPDQLQLERGYNTLLTYYCGSLVRALRALFPNLKLVKQNFDFISRSFWADSFKRRNYFEELAKQRGFDPLVPENWYSLRKKDVMGLKGLTGVLSHHKSSLVIALCDLFPDIGLISSNFGVVHRYYWADPQNRRKFFINFAKEHGFDPLIPTNWYKIKKFQIGSKDQVLEYHKNKLSNALMELFPNIGLKKEKF